MNPTLERSCTQSLQETRQVEASLELLNKLKELEALRDLHRAAHSRVDLSTNFVVVEVKGRAPATDAELSTFDEFAAKLRSLLASK